MTFVTERSLIEAYLSSNWTATSIAFQNAAFEPVSGTAFIRSSILGGTSGPLEFNPSPQIIYAGVMIIGIFVPKDTGTATARSYADTLSGLFAGHTLSNIEFDEAAELIDLGQEEGWYHLNFSINFIRFES